MHRSATTKGKRRTNAIALAGELYTNHKRRLLAIANQNSSTNQDAEEALHDAFALFIDRFDPESSAPALAWLTLTLKRCCWATYRRQQLITTTATTPQPNRTTDQSHSLTEAPRQPHEIAELNEQTQELQTNFKNLKPQENQALTLLALGYSYQEIAELTGWTYTKVNRCITEGRACLRKTLATNTDKTMGAKTTTK